MNNKFHGWRKWVARSQEWNIPKEAPRVSPEASAAVAMLLGDMRMRWMRQAEERPETRLPWEEGQ